MLVRVSLVFLAWLFVAGKLFGNDGELEMKGAGSAHNINMQAHYVSKWKPSEDSSDVPGEFVLTVRYDGRERTMKILISSQDDDLNQLTVAINYDGRIQNVGQGECYISNHGFGDRYMLRYDGWHVPGEALGVDEPKICDMKFKLPGQEFNGAKIKLRKVYKGDTLLLIDGSAAVVWIDRDILDFELLTSAGEDTLTECGTDSGVMDCFSKKDYGHDD